MIFCKTFNLKWKGYLAETIAFKIPLSPQTVTRRIEQMAQDVEVKLFEQVRNASEFRIAVDEASTTNKKAYVGVAVR